MLTKIDEVAKTVTEHIDSYRLDLAADVLYHYIWHEVADKILEESKPILQGEDVVAKASRQATLLTILETSLKLLHPFMPFVTEEIWQSLPQKEKREELLMIAKWPTKNQ